jgi:hypothetical protein
LFLKIVLASWLDLCFELAMKKVSDIFNELGGPAVVSEILGCSKHSAIMMSRREIVPVWYWKRLQSACKKKRISGVTSDRLVELHSRK